MSKHPGGRPSKYTRELGNEICKKIAEGEGLRRICKEKGMPSLSTIMLWVLNNEEFSEQYKTACNVRAEHLFEELLEIADEKSKDVLRARLRVDTRKWYLSKVLPKKFGEKVDVTSGGKPIPILGNVYPNPSDKQDNSSKEEN